MPRSRDFAQVEVFGSAPYLGNPVAVVLDGEDLTDEDMQRVAPGPAVPAASTSPPT